MTSSLPNNLKGNLVEQKINRLTFLKADAQKFPNRSPAWKELQKGPSRVKTLSKYFEEQSKIGKENWRSEEKPSPLSTGSSASPCMSPKPRRSSLSRLSHGLSSNSPVKLTTKLDRIIQELLNKELTYIQALERGINSFVSVIKTGQDNVPPILRHQTFQLFGNIETIFQLHKDSVYPRLLVCNGDVKLIAQTITSYIQNDLFYCYIIYAINQKAAEHLVSSHQDLFEGLRSPDDLLGVQSFIIQPIQRLPRYKMFFDEMIKELSKDLTSNKEAAAACCVTEKSLQRFLARINEALYINDIIETHEFNASVQMDFVMSIQKDLGININEPMMLLVPKTSSNFPFRTPINVYDLGKFIKTSTLKAHETSTGRTFPSKVFLFEKCLMYTKIISENSLGYRNHFGFMSGFAFITNESHVSFRISGANKNHDVILFSCDNIENIADLKKHINQFYDPRRSADSAFIDGSELMISENPSAMSDDDEDWIVTECEDTNGEGLAKTSSECKRFH